jgi:hypothetical protein
MNDDDRRWRTVQRMGRLCGEAQWRTGLERVRRGEGSARRGSARSQTVQAGSDVGAQRLGELERSTTKAWGVARRGRGDGGKLDRGEGELSCPFIEEEGERRGRRGRGRDASVHQRY